MPDHLRDEVDLALIEIGMGKRFNPSQPRNPHTGEWIGVGTPLTRGDAKPGVRVMATISGWFGVITEFDDRPGISGSGWKVKVRWDPQPGHPVRATREGRQEAWVTNPNLHLELAKPKP